MSKPKKYEIEVRRYLPGQTSYGSESAGKITGDFGRYEVIETVTRVLRSEQIGNFCPFFCTYKGDKRVLVHSAEGDISDPFRSDGTYLKRLFICVTQTFELGNRVMLRDPTDRMEFHAMVQGTVVKYKGAHDPANPRVRWISGWATTTKAEALRLMTASEIALSCPPELFKTDL